MSGVFFWLQNFLERVPAPHSLCTLGLSQAWLVVAVQMKGPQPCEDSWADALEWMVDGMGCNGSVISDFVLFLVCYRVVDTATWD